MCKRARCVLAGLLLHGGQRRGELDQAAAQRFRQADVREGAGNTDNGQGLGLPLREAGEVGAPVPEQRHAAARAALRVHGHAGGGERVDVAVDRPLGDLEPPGEIPRLQLPLGLEQQH